MAEGNDRRLQALGAKRRFSRRWIVIATRFCRLNPLTFLPFSRSWFFRSTSMHCPRTIKLLLMLPASLSRSPVV
jgi:hypothetical protein